MNRFTGAQLVKAFIGSIGWMNNLAENEDDGLGRFRWSFLECNENLSAAWGVQAFLHQIRYICGKQLLSSYGVPCAGDLSILSTALVLGGTWSRERE